MLKDTLNADLKAAMLARDTEKVDTLKGIKSAILYAEVEAGKRDEGLNDEEILSVIKKESKKRQESIDLYIKGGNQAMADKESSEKQIIDAYLPQQLSEDELNQLIDTEMKTFGIDEITQQDMGKIIGSVKGKHGAEVDGATLARLVKERISS